MSDAPQPGPLRHRGNLPLKHLRLPQLLVKRVGGVDAVAARFAAIVRERLGGDTCAGAAADRPGLTRTVRVIRPVAPGHVAHADLTLRADGPDLLVRVDARPRTRITPLRAVLYAAAERVARRWALTPQAGPHRIALLSLLEPILAKSGMDSWADNHHFYHRSFLVPAARVREARRDVFAVLRDYLEAEDVPLQLRVLVTVGEALNGPMPMMGVAVKHEVLAAWKPDQLDLLDILAGFLAVPRPVVVQLRVVEAVRY